MKFTKTQVLSEMSPHTHIYESDCKRFRIERHVISVLYMDGKAMYQSHCHAFCEEEAFWLSQKDVALKLLTDKGICPVQVMNSSGSFSWKFGSNNNGWITLVCNLHEQTWAVYVTPKVGDRLYLCKSCDLEYAVEVAESAINAYRGNPSSVDTLLAT